MFRYKTKKGIVSCKIGKQNFPAMEVEVAEEDGTKVICKMFQDKFGYIGFIYSGEKIHFLHNIKE